MMDIQIPDELALHFQSLADAVGLDRDDYMLTVLRERLKNPDWLPSANQFPLK